MKYLYLFLILLNAIVFAKIDSSNNKNDWDIKANFQLRSEYDARNLSNNEQSKAITSIKTLVSAQKTVWDDIDFFCEMLLTNNAEHLAITSNNIFLHQTYVKINKIYWHELSLQMGRYKLDFGNGRMLGYDDWENIPKTYDGFSFKYINNNFKIDVFKMNLTNNFQNNMNFFNNSKVIFQTDTSNNSIYGTNIFYSNDYESHLLDIYLFKTDYYKLYNSLHVNLYNLGFEHNYKSENINTELEIGFQYGKLNDVINQAYFVGGKFEYNYNFHFFDFKYTLFSGNKAGSNTHSVFVNDFGKKFGNNGLMNYFNDLQSSANSLGLQDISFSWAYNPLGSKFNGEMSLHYFTTDPINNKPINIGEEYDLFIKYYFVKQSELVFGGSIFRIEDSIKNIYVINNNLLNKYSYWFFIMMRFKI